MIRSRQRTADYVTTQGRVNAFHLNGQVELLGEFDAALEYAEDLQTALGQPESVLILGCRTGYEVRAFTGVLDPARVVGVDIVLPFLVYGRKLGTKCLVAADMEALPFKGKAFDWTFSAGTLEHCPRPDRAVQEMCRVARQACYVTADLDENTENPSHFSFSPVQKDWADLFDSTFEVEYKKVDNSVHILARRL
jgi:ubiquinone/menaquinone biosynthesis C-methylase UbiE